GRDRDQAVAREALGQIAGVTHEAVALVHHDHDRHLGIGVWHRSEGRHPCAAGDGAGANLAHGFDASARRLASTKFVIGGAAGKSPIATSASRLALMPSSNSAPSRATTL